MTRKKEKVIDDPREEIKFTEVFNKDNFFFAKSLTKPGRKVYEKKGRMYKND